MPTPIEVLETLPPPVILPELDVGNVVEEAEQLMRESAPHDFDVLVIGGGPGGYTAAIRAAQLGAHVGLVEERELGGTSLNRGCIPTKTLLQSVSALRTMRRARDFGIAVDGAVRPDFDAMNARKARVIEHLRGELDTLIADHSIEVIAGRARFIGEHVVEVSGDGGAQRINAVHIVIATGSVPARLEVPGSELLGVVTSDELLHLEVVPGNIVTIGGGAIGIEFAYLFHEIGARSTVIEPSSAILPGEDAEIATEMMRSLQGTGINLVTDAHIERIEAKSGRLSVVYRQNGEVQSLPAQMVLMAQHREPNTSDLGLDEIGIAHSDGKISVDENRETSVAGVYAVGDCTRDVGWAHLAASEGTLVAEHIMRQPRSVDLSWVPRCCYTFPEFASVGLTPDEAKKSGRKVSVGKCTFADNGKAAIIEEQTGWVQVVIDAQSELLLGCQIIGPHATELINLAVLALKSSQTAEDLASAAYAYPTLGETLAGSARAARGSQGTLPEIIL